jgi:hypothetical protein
MDEFRPSLHYGATKAASPEQNQLALFKLAHYRHTEALDEIGARARLSQWAVRNKK